MVRKYNPEVKTEYGRGMWDGIDSHDAVMKEGQYGQWVKLATFEQVTAGQRKENERLKDHVRALQERIKEMTEGVTLKTEACPCCGQTVINVGPKGQNHWIVNCQICTFEGPTVPVKPGTTNEYAQKQALVAWNKRATRFHKAQPPIGEIPEKFK